MLNYRCSRRGVCLSLCIGSIQCTAEEQDCSARSGCSAGALAPLLKLLSQAAFLDVRAFNNICCVFILFFLFFPPTVGMSAGKYTCWCRALSVRLADTFTGTGGGLWNKSGNNFKASPVLQGIPGTGDFFFFLIG